MNTNEYLKATFDPLEVIQLRPRAVCKDGFEISIQASFHHYCSPRTTFEGPYAEVELGYPSEDEPLIHDYAEGDDYTNTVYGYVPVGIVDQVLEKHGGLR